jgi:microcystin-dependent protein
MADPYLGEIRVFAGNFAPLGWALCDGQLLPIAQYDALFTIIGTTYGGDGQETFALPDLRGRWPIGVGGGPGLSPRVLAETGGVESHALTEAELPGHTHAVPAVSGPADTSNPAGAVPAGSRVPTYTTGEATPGGPATTPAGGGQPHSNLSPYLVCNYIIALQGIFPVRA